MERMEKSKEGRLLNTFSGVSFVCGHVVYRREAEEHFGCQSRATVDENVNYVDDLLYFPLFWEESIPAPREQKA